MCRVVVFYLLALEIPLQLLCPISLAIGANAVCTPSYGTTFDKSFQNPQLVSIPSCLQDSDSTLTEVLEHSYSLALW